MTNLVKGVSIAFTGVLRKTPPRVKRDCKVRNSTPLWEYPIPPKHAYQGNSEKEGTGLVLHKDITC